MTSDSTPSSTTAHLWLARSERANIDAALAWSATRDPLLALDIVNGFGWAWVVLGDSRGAQRILTALDAIGEAAPPGTVPAPFCSQHGSRHRPAASNLREHIAAATELAERIDDLDLRARCLYYLAYVVSHSGEFRSALELTARSSGIYDTMDRPWDQAACWLFAARAAISAGDQERSVQAADRCNAGCARWRIRGCMFEPRPCSASSPGSSTGSTMLSCTSAVRRTPPGVSVFSRRRRTR